MVRIYSKVYYENVRRWLEEVANTRDVYAWMKESEEAIADRLQGIDIGSAISEWFDSDETTRWSMKNKKEIYKETLDRFKLLGD